VRRPNDGEVLTIERRDAAFIKPLRGGNHGCVNGAERQITIASDEFRNPQPVGRSDGFDGEFACGEVCQETHLRLETNPGAEQVNDLGDNERRDDQRARMRLEQLKAGLVVPVVSVHIRVQRSGVDDQRDGDSSSARICSIRWEMSSRPLRPAAAARRRRRPLLAPR
jgi:hypothetical protein